MSLKTIFIFEAYFLSSWSLDVLGNFKYLLLISSISTGSSCCMFNRSESADKAVTIFLDPRAENKTDHDEIKSIKKVLVQKPKLQKSNFKRSKTQFIIAILMKKFKRVVTSDFISKCTETNVQSCTETIQNRNRETLVHKQAKWES
jgi:hypothetical protein